MNQNYMYIIANDLDIPIPFEIKQRYIKEDIQKLMIPLECKLNDTSRIIYVSSLILYDIDPSRWGTILCGKIGKMEDPMIIMEEGRETLEMMIVVLGLFHGVNLNIHVNLLDCAFLVYIVNSMEHFPKNHSVITYNLKLLETMFVTAVKTHIENGEFVKIWEFIKFISYDSKKLLDLIIQNCYEDLVALKMLPISFAYLEGKVGEFTTAQYLMYLLLRNQDKMYKDRDLLVDYISVELIKHKGDFMNDKNIDQIIHNLEFMDLDSLILKEFINKVMEIVYPYRKKNVMRFSTVEEFFKK